MTLTYAMTIAISLALTQPDSGSHPDTVNAKQCKDGYKWSESEKKCVLDPFSGNDY